RDLVGLGHPAQVRPRRAVRVYPTRLQQRPDVTEWLVEFVVMLPADGDLATAGVVESQHHPHRGRLAGTVGAEKPGDGARSYAKRQVVYSESVAVAFGEALRLDHFSSCT